MENKNNYYGVFVSENSAFDFSFLYPRAWHAREIKGSNYDEVFVAGPRNAENTFTLALIVRVTIARDQNGKQTPLENFIAEYLTKLHAAQGFELRAQSSGKLANVRATEIEITYTTLLPPNNINATRTQIMERRIFLQRENRIYEMIWRATAPDYEQSLGVFKRVVQTFEFQDAPRETYQPFIIPAPAALALAEERAEYKTP